MFIFSDFVSLVLQAAGGGISATGNTKAESNEGRYIMIAGLAWQVVSLIVFLIVWADFMWRVHKTPAEKRTGRLLDVSTGFKRFRWFQWALLVATITIFIRSVYRVVELQGGFNGTVANNQAGFMVFEGPMIIIACAVLTVLHPGYAFAGRWSEAVWSLRKRNVKVDGSDGSANEMDMLSPK